MKKMQKNSSVSPKFLVLIMGIVLLVGGLTIYFNLGASLAGQEAQLNLPYLTAVQAAQSLPKTVEPQTFSYKSTVAAYSAAKEIPEVLAQQPCYCECYRMGHRSLLDCFASAHASDCDTCLKEALFALQEHRRGKSAAQIRQGISRGAWQAIQL
jgi:hypothetical protein